MSETPDAGQDVSYSHALIEAPPYLPPRYRPTPQRPKARKPPKSSAPQVSRVAELQTMPYTDYLKSPEWQKLRRVVFKWAGGRCQICNDSRGPFHVHHRDYSRVGCELLSDVVLLCERCHALFHERRKVEGAR